MKPISLSLGLTLLILCGPVAHGDGKEPGRFKRIINKIVHPLGGDAATHAPPPPQQLMPAPPSEAELEAPFVYVDPDTPFLAPPPAAPAKPKVPRALGDSFGLDRAQSEPPIPEAKPIITQSGACQPDAVEFDPCPNSWFFVPQGGVGKNKFNLSPAAVAERDHLFSLAALAVVNEDWQFSPEDAKTNAEVAQLPRRGHNIGGVMVDQNGKLVWWERNSNGIECSGTNHGETRMMISYLKFPRRNTLQCHTIYTSLEPCAMCSGMMVQQKIARTLYVQKDHGFGAAIERLHQPFGPRQFQCGFPRAPFSRHAEDVKASKDLDIGFHAFMKNTGSDDLTSYLQTKEAHGIYQAAEDELLAFKALPENEATLKEIRAMIADLRSPIYHRANQTVEQHVQIERARRSQQVRMEARAGFPFEIDACCRPPLMSNLGRIGQNQPLSPACKADSPTLTPVPPLQ